MTPSDAYVRSFLYLLYTLIKLYYTHTHKKSEPIKIPPFVFFVLLKIRVGLLPIFEAIRCKPCGVLGGYIKKAALYREAETERWNPEGLEIHQF